MGYVSAVSPSDASAAAVSRILRRASLARRHQLPDGARRMGRDPVLEAYAMHAMDGIPVPPRKGRLSAADNLSGAGPFCLLVGKRTRMCEQLRYHDKVTDRSVVVRRKIAVLSLDGLCAPHLGERAVLA